MLSKFAADIVVLIHFAFVIFVVLSVVLVYRWPKLGWLHLPAAIWGTTIEFAGFICPLTPLENKFRIEAGQAGYSGGFIEQYLVPVVYPSGLTRSTQIVLGVIVISINLVLYGLLVARRTKNT